MDTSQPLTSVTVAICTFRRPSLKAALRSLRGQAPVNVDLRVLVIDNDDQPSAQTLVAACAKDLEYAVEYRHVPGRNIALARNACLAAAPEGWLAFLDDDETAAPGWLAALVEAAGRGEPAAVFGPVHALYEAGAPAWMRKGDFHSFTVVFVNGEIRTGYTSNALINLAHPAVTGLRFDLALGRSGGEDTAYFRQIWRSGGRFAYADGAVVEEIVVADRARFGWLVRRRFRYGQTHGHAPGETRGRFGTLAAMGPPLAKAAYCGLAALAHLSSPVGWRRYVLRGALHVGVLARLSGMRDLVLYGGPAPAAPPLGPVLR